MQKSMNFRGNKASTSSKSYKQAQSESALKIDQFAKSRKYTPIKKKLIGAQEKKILNYYEQVQQQEKSKEKKRKRYEANHDELSGEDEASISQSDSAPQPAEAVKIWRKEDLHYDDFEATETEMKRNKRQKYKENKRKRARGDEASNSQDDENQRDKKRRKTDSVVLSVQDFSNENASTNIIGKPDPFHGGSGSRDADDESQSDPEPVSNHRNLNNTPSPKRALDNHNNNANQKKEKKIKIKGVDKSNPYYKAMVEFERKKLEKEEKEKQERIKVHEKQVRSKQRSKQKQKSFQQTQRGQPLMKNKINALLDKIESK